MGDRKKISESVDSPSEMHTEEYNFIKETIKNRPMNRKQIFLRAAFVVGAAALFGVVAAVAFFMTFSAMGEYEESRQEEHEVEIPKDDPKETQQPKSADTPAPRIVEVPRSITLADYEKVYNEILSVSESPRKALVHVSGVQKKEDLLDNTFLSSGESEGIIIENNGSELFILTELAALSEAEDVEVEFTDGAVAKALQVKGDAATGLAVVRVAVASVKKETMDRIAVAKLGNSYSLVQGKAVIAIGKPTGYNDSVVYGNVTSVTNKVPVTDMEYNLLTTNILGSGQGSGMLLDASGSIIGVIAMAYGPEDTQTMVKALSVSQLKPLIESLSNGKDIVYMGVRGQEVSEETAKKLKIPRGIFVDKVEADSPAMEAGVQRGDIITTFNKKNVHAMQRFYTELQKCEKGQKAELTVMRKGAEDYGQTKINVTLDVQ